MADLAANARSAYDLVRERAWIDAGLRVGTDLGPLSQTLRPIDTLNQAGLGWLSSYLQPHQETLDQLAGNAAVIRTFAETWQTVATQVAEIQHRLAGSATADTAQWQGSAADKYRTSAAGLADAVAGSGTLSAAVASVANEIGEAAAAARRSVADQVADLVQQLIQQVGPAAAVGGVTPQLITQATGIIAQYQAPIADIMRQLRTTITGAATTIGSTDIALGTTRSWLAEFVRDRPPQHPPTTTTERHPQRVPPHRLTSTDTIFGSHRVACRQRTLVGDVACPVAAGVRGQPPAQRSDRGAGASKTHWATASKGNGYAMFYSGLDAVAGIAAGTVEESSGGTSPHAGRLFEVGDMLGYVGAWCFLVGTIACAHPT